MTINISNLLRYKKKLESIYRNVNILNNRSSYLYFMKTKLFTRPTLVDLASILQKKLVMGIWAILTQCWSVSQGGGFSCRYSLTTLS